MSLSELPRKGARPVRSTSLLLRPLRLGIAGAGSIARERARGFQALSGVNITGIFSRPGERLDTLCQETGARPYVCWESFLRDVDAVVICCPNHLHARWVRDSLAAGNHTLVEYPLALTPADADRTEQMAASAGLVLMVGNTIIHERLFRYAAAANRRKDGFLSGSSRVALYDRTLAQSWYLDPAKSGSCFVAFHYHHIEFFKRLLGKVRQVRAVPSPTNPPTGKNPALSGGTLVLEHTAGRVSTIQWYLSAASDQGLFRNLLLSGPASALSITSDYQDVSQVSHGADRRRPISRFRNSWGMSGSCQDFLAAIAGRLPSAERLVSDQETLRIAFAAEQSAQGQGPVRIDG